MECVRLRVKDVDFEQNQVVVREGKGFKDRVTVLPQSLKEPLREHLKPYNAHPLQSEKSEARNPKSETISNTGMGKGANQDAMGEGGNPQRS